MGIAGGGLSACNELPETISTRAMELIVLLSRAVIDAGGPMGEVLDISHRQVAELGQPKSGDDVRAWAMNSLAALMDRIPTGDNGDHLIERAVAHIRLHLADPELQLKDVACAVNLSASHLAHLFKARTGSSYLKYLTNLRIQEARKLLATTDLTIAAVGLMVGYENCAYFHRVFRREVSMTPSTYRQTARVA